MISCPFCVCAHHISRCSLTVEHKGSEIEKLPYCGFIHLKVLTEDFEAMMWQV
ncbi:MAG: hypothetical protein AABZ15_06400 [Nitrospirota bacterium]